MFLWLFAVACEMLVPMIIAKTMKKMCLFVDIGCISIVRRTLMLLLENRREINADVPKTTGMWRLEPFYVHRDLKNSNSTFEKNVQKPFSVKQINMYHNMVFVKTLK